MKYLKLFESFDKYKIDKICREYNIKNYTINPDGSIDIDESITLRGKKLTKLPLKFNKINGSFNCNHNKLASLEGSPVEIDRYFDCSYNRLTSFEFSPNIIRGQFGCEHNNIKTFEYFPSFVGCCFFCWGNPIYYVWILFDDTTKIELFNNFDIFRDEDTDKPAIVMDR